MNILLLRSTQQFGQSQCDSAFAAILKSEADRSQHYGSCCTDDHVTRPVVADSVSGCWLKEQMAG